MEQLRRRQGARRGMTSSLDLDCVLPAKPHWVIVRVSVVDETLSPSGLAARLGTDR